MTAPRAVAEALRGGLFTRADLVGFGHVVTGVRMVGTGPDDFVWGSSVGIGVQDAAAGRAVVHAARGVGR